MEHFLPMELIHIQSIKSQTNEGLWRILDSHYKVKT